MAAGSCICGAIKFAIATDVSEVIVCHCSICRRANGSNGVAVVLVKNEYFSWVSGEEFIRTWQHPDADWAKKFCQICGSPVPGINDENHTFVPAGTISEGGDKLNVTHHIWVDSKACWDEIGDSGRRHREAFKQ